MNNVKLYVTEQDYEAVLSHLRAMQALRNEMIEYGISEQSLTAINDVISILSQVTKMLVKFNSLNENEIYTLLLHNTRRVIDKGKYPHTVKEGDFTIHMTDRANAVMQQFFMPKSPFSSLGIMFLDAPDDKPKTT